MSSARRLPTVDRPPHEWRTRTKLFPHEIELGRSVPADWDLYLTESWAQRKARLALERAERRRIEGAP